MINIFFIDMLFFYFNLTEYKISSVEYQVTLIFCLGGLVGGDMTTHQNVLRYMRIKKLHETQITC